MKGRCPLVSGRQICAARELLNLSQKELAQRSGVAVHKVASYENGGDLSDAEVQKLVTACGDKMKFPENGVRLEQ